MTRLCTAVMISLCLGCGDSDSNPANDAGIEADASTEWMCDPVGSNPEMGALLNAPLANDVEVIEKTPQHPGHPGPDNLPTP